jgi:tetratricopeptide (TPR) repeat protein
MQKQFISAFLGLSAILPLLPVPAAQALPSGQVRNVTDRVVLIKTSSGQGSGVIIKHVGNVYTVLTAAHVVSNNQNLPLEITTVDRQRHTATNREIYLAPDRLDLATFTFKSELTYPVAELGTSNQIVRGQAIFAAGFLGPSLQFYPGTVVANSQQPQSNGYGLILGTADILPGMSGGGLFDKEGKLIGINGKGVGKVNANIKSQDRSNRFKPVSGLAIPIDTFAKVADKLQVNIDRVPTDTVAAAPTADDAFISAEYKSQQGDYRGAVADYDRTLALNPNFSEVYFRRGIARSLLKNWQGAADDYTQAIALKPEHAESYLHRGNMRNILADWRGAKADFDFVIALNPHMLSAYVGRGIALCELNDCRSGLKDYDRAIDANPTDAYAYANRGLAYYRLGNRQDAISSYIAAAEIYQQGGKDRDYLDTVKKIKELVGG